jgi:gas vesicle protein
MRNADYYSNDYYGNEFAGWSAFLAGAFIGAGLALLFAPQTGSELRGVLRNYAARTKDEMMDRGREAWDTAVERGKEYMERGQESLQQAGRSAREYAQAGQEKLKEAGSEAAARLKEAGREAANRV